MSRTIRALLLGGLIALVAACATQPAPPSQPVDILSWDRSPTAIIFQMTQTYDGEDPIRARDRLPLCTLFGNNRLIWVTVDPRLGQQVYQAQIDDSTVISFLEFLIRDQKFYGLPDYSKQAPPAEVTPPSHILVSSLSLNLNSEPHTVSNDHAWPNDTFNQIQLRCGKLSATPAAYKPTGAWISAVQLPNPTGNPVISWSNLAPFRLTMLSNTKSRAWLPQGQILDQVWGLTRQGQGTIQWSDAGQIYLIGVEVPGLSVSAPLQPTSVP